MDQLAANPRLAHSFRRYCRILNVLNWVFAFIGLFFIALAIVFVLRHMVEWLKLGVWQPWTVSHAFYRMLPTSSQAWINAPDSWFGLWKIVHEVGTWSAWLVSLVLSLLFGAWSIIVESRAKRLSNELDNRTHAQGGE
jgi:hypothetical protein